MTKIHSLVTARSLLEASSAMEDAAQVSQQSAVWAYRPLCGRLVELSTEVGGAAPLTIAASLVLQAQQDREMVAWISGRSEQFFPPDMYAHGVDVEALVVIRLDGAHDAARAADKLLRSGAFGAIFLDVGHQAQVPMPLQSRLLKLAEMHHTAVVFLTEKSEQSSSLSSLISLRAQIERQRGEHGRFRIAVEVIKDKRLGPGRHHEEECRGPLGLC